MPPEKLQSRVLPVFSLGSNSNAPHVELRRAQRLLIVTRWEWVIAELVCSRAVRPRSTSPCHGRDVRFGSKRTCAVQNVMSALPPKADICSAQANVCFVPIADTGRLSRERWSVPPTRQRKSSPKEHRAEHRRKPSRWPVVGWTPQDANCPNAKRHTNAKTINRRISSHALSSPPPSTPVHRRCRNFLSLHLTPKNTNLKQSRLRSLQWGIELPRGSRGHSGYFQQ